MSGSDRPPVVGIPACLMQGDGSGYHRVSEKYVDAVVDGAGALPVVVPAIGPRLDIPALLAMVDGLLITGSPSNVEPHHYAGPPARPCSPRDPARDATTLPLIRQAVDEGVPLLAICRGLQELNVAYGGSLHQHVHELPGRLDHRSDKTVPHHERYRDAHPVRLSPGGVLESLLERSGEIAVNSLHAQAIDRLAEALAVEAVAPDGTIEAARVIDAPGFVLAVQWHPEWRVLENPVSRRLFAAFGAACRARAVARDRAAFRIRHGRHGAVAAGA